MKIEITARKPTEQYGFIEVKMTLEEKSNIPQAINAALRDLYAGMPTEDISVSIENHSQLENKEVIENSSQLEEKIEEVKEKKTTKKKSKNTAYDRNIQVHKNIFSSLFTELEPKWKKDTELCKKIQKFSADSEGQDFLDAEGLVLPEFKAKAENLVGK